MVPRKYILEISELFMLTLLLSVGIYQLMSIRILKHSMAFKPSQNYTEINPVTKNNDSLYKIEDSLALFQSNFKNFKGNSNYIGFNEINIKQLYMSNCRIMVVLRDSLNNDYLWEHRFVEDTVTFKQIDSLIQIKIYPKSIIEIRFSNGCIAEINKSQFENDYPMKFNDVKINKIILKGAMVKNRKQFFNCTTDSFLMDSPNGDNTCHLKFENLQINNYFLASRIQGPIHTFEFLDMEVKNMMIDTSFISQCDFNFNGFPNIVGLNNHKSKNLRQFNKQI